MKNSKLTPLHYPSLRHAEFGQFIVRFFEDFETTSLNPATDADFKAMFEGLQAQIPVFNNALDQIRASEESEKIALLDADRDAAMQALKDSIKPYRNAKTAAEKDAYTSVKILLDQYKNVEDASFEEETNRLNSLTSRLQDAEYSSHVTELGIAKFVNNLAAANTAFNTLFAKRSHDTSQKVTYDVKALRKTLTSDYRKMANYTATLAGVKGDGFYKDVLAVLNNGRKYFADVVVARRQGKNTPPPNPA